MVGNKLKLFLINRVFLRTLGFILLCLNGIGALLGGASLMLFPDGSQLHLPTELLKKSPFPNYFVPGLVLFVFNGFSSLMVLYLLLTRKKKAGHFLVMQGAILLGWILAQVMFIQITDVLQGIFALVGLSLVVIGVVLSKRAH